MTFLALVIACLVGFFFGFAFCLRHYERLTGKDPRTYQDGWNAALGSERVVIEKARQYLQSRPEND